MENESGSDGFDADEIFPAVRSEWDTVWYQEGRGENSSAKRPRLASSFRPWKRFDLLTVSSRKRLLVCDVR
jgi:hypothetical protein